MHNSTCIFLGARFKRFQNEEDAKNYAKNGDIFCKSPEVSVKNQPTGEPSSSFPSVSRIMFNRLKKSIELKVGSYMFYKFRKKKIRRS